MDRKIFAAALTLLLALSARAQVEVRPVLELPATPASLAPAAAMSGALAEFASMDLRTASAGAARGAGETLLLRALGAEAPAAAAADVAAAGPSERSVPSLAASAIPLPRAEPQVYLLSQPLREPVELGRGAVAAHLVYAAMLHVVDAAVAYWTTGSPAASVAAVAVGLVGAPIGLAARSLAHLGYRYWRSKLAVLKELARLPGVSRVKVLTTSDVTFWGPLARRKENTGLIFVEAGEKLPESVGRFGAPIPLGDLTSSRVRLDYVAAGKAASASWTPTLKELLDGRPIPPETAAAWRAAAKGSKSALKGLLDASKGKNRVEAALIDADGSERPIGSILEGPAARKLVGLGRLDRLRAFLGRSLPSRSIPISDSRIERPGDKTAPGPFAAALRAWRRLTGSLIARR